MSSPDSWLLLTNVNYMHYSCMTLGSIQLQFLAPYFSNKSMNPKDTSGSKFYDSMNVAADFFFFFFSQVSLFGEILT